MNRSTDQLMNSQPKYHIGIDARLSGLRHGGIGRYIQNLIFELLQLKESSIHWHFFFYDQHHAFEVLGDFLPAKENSPFSIHFAPIRHYSIAEQLKMPEIFNQTQLDLLHVPHFNIPFLYQGKIVVTIHDLLWHEYRGAHVTTLPSWQYWLKHFAYTWLTKQAVERSKCIFVPAETIKSTVSRYYPNVESKISVTKEGIDQSFIRTKKKSGLNWNLKIKNLKFFLYIGSLYPHKNVSVILKALKKLPDYQLILVGARDVFAEKTMQAVEQQAIKKQVRFLGYQPDEVIAELLHHSTALIQPSLSEGFGLTGLEAMGTSTPVICSDIPIFREIYQDGALFFDPNDADSFIQQLESLPDQKTQLIKKAEKVVKTYSWKKMAKETLHQYINVLEK